jgi:phosphotriesterase-related protein
MSNPVHTRPHQLKLEAVTGTIAAASDTVALAHEHMFADFHDPQDRQFMDVDWGMVAQACLSSLSVLRAQGVNLVVDWTTPSSGRSTLMLRELSKKSGIAIIAATGLYQTKLPCDYMGLEIDEIANRFYGELALGTDATPIRAGFIKIATTEIGPTEGDTRIHRAAARAAIRAGCTIALHSPYAEATDEVVKTLSDEGFDLRRLVWGHAQCSPIEKQLEMASAGVIISYDAISASDDPFFFGPTDDASMLDRLETMVKADFGQQVLVSTDASVCVSPPEIQYDRHNAHLHGVFADKLSSRLGLEQAAAILGENVAYAFRIGDHVKPRD